MEIRGIDISTNTESNKAFANRTESATSPISHEKASKQMLLTELSTVLLKYNNSTIRKVHQDIGKMDFKNSNAAAEIFNINHELNKSSIITPSDTTTIKQILFKLSQ